MALMTVMTMMCTCAGFLKYGQAAVEPASDVAAKNYSVSIGETWNTVVNITQLAPYTHLYLTRICENSTLTPLIKLQNGEAGNGTCYEDTLKCQTYYGLQHIGKNKIEITVRLLSKAMQGLYGLFTYCRWTDHSCISDVPIGKFQLNIEGLPPNVKPTKKTGSQFNSTGTVEPTKNTGLQLTGFSVNVNSESGHEPTGQQKDNAATGMAVTVAVPIASLTAAVVFLLI